jgi:hypothetical protein
VVRVSAARLFTEEQVLSGYSWGPSDLTAIQWAEQTITWAGQYLHSLNPFSLRAAERTITLMREAQ